jgi:hypothetical protein
MTAMMEMTTNSSTRVKPRQSREMQRFVFIASGRSKNQAVLEGVTGLCAGKVDELAFH